ncbi:MAG: hypothetical protein P1U47_12210 [Zhongshania sp.]|uniref:hypothetical protein n=1 Tax=Zhongshania sp. TaxID=1971902 RepID=UPI00262CAF00|nr:hypothetical protein [Zhongshania sp.]MDF1693134.1 hypothetical protein [Zhongshania sp.]
MMDMGSSSGEKCPFELNFKPETFKAGDLVSYRVSGTMMDMPFVGVLVEVHDDHVMLAHYGGDDAVAGNIMRGTKTDRPVVSEEDALR